MFHLVIRQENTESLGKHEMKIQELLESKSRTPGKYVYHSAHFPNLAKGLRSVKAKGLIPSKDGYSGPGVYFAYDIDGTYDHVSANEATTFRVKWDDLVKMFGEYPKNKNGIQRTDDELIVPSAVPSKLLEVQYFENEWWDIESALSAESYDPTG